MLAIESCAIFHVMMCCYGYRNRRVVLCDLGTGQIEKMEMLSEIEPVRMIFEVWMQ